MPITKNMRMLQLVQWSTVTACGIFASLVSLSACSSRPPGALSATQPSEYGTLAFMANGEDFVRQGMLSKDQWMITFDHLYVTLERISAHGDSQVTESDTQTSAHPTVNLAEPITVDLAAGDEEAAPILMASASAPAGQYRGLRFDVVPALSGPAKGSSLLLQGQAQKASRTIQFALRFNPSLSFRCGDYVGDERKGLVNAQQTAEIEATFHFDHLFGDGNVAADDSLNLEALGFEPIAQLAQNGAVSFDVPAQLSQLSAEDTEKLQAILLNLGHVGEGHCEADQR